MRTRINFVAFFLVAMGITFASAASAALIDNNFDGVANDIGPSFASHTWGHYSNADPDTGVLLLAPAGHYRVGLSTTSTVDASSAAGFTATWSVASSNVTSAAVTEAGWFFGVYCYEWQQQSLG